MHMQVMQIQVKSVMSINVHVKKKLLCVMVVANRQAGLRILCLESTQIGEGNHMFYHESQ